MRYNHKHYWSDTHQPKRRSFWRSLFRGWKLAVIIVLLIIGTNYLMMKWRMDGGSLGNVSFMGWGEELYLVEHAKLYVSDLGSFEKEVKKISKKLEVPPAWLMTVMYVESKFDPSIENLQGSGAVGLIQFLPSTAEQLGTSAQALRQMHIFHQLDYVEQYLQLAKFQDGPFRSLVDLYLAIVYPPARKTPNCELIFQRPSQQYKLHYLLDENQDGIISCLDIEQRFARMFPEAYNMKP